MLTSSHSTITDCRNRSSTSEVRHHIANSCGEEKILAKDLQSKHLGEDLEVLISQKKLSRKFVSAGNR